MFCVVSKIQLVLLVIFDLSSANDLHLDKSEILMCSKELNQKLMSLLLYYSGAHLWDANRSCIFISQDHVYMPKGKAWSVWNVVNMQAPIKVWIPSNVSIKLGSICTICLVKKHGYFFCHEYWWVWEKKLSISNQTSFNPLPHMPILGSFQFTCK